MHSKITVYNERRPTDLKLGRYRNKNARVLSTTAIQLWQRYVKRRTHATGLNVKTQEHNCVGKYQL